jgi:hypothetical protein
MSWWKRRTASNAAAIEHPRLGRLAWDGNAWVGTIAEGDLHGVEVVLEGAEVGASGERVAAVLTGYPDLRAGVESALARLLQDEGATRGGLDLGEADARRLAAECVLESILADEQGAIELAFSLDRVWPDASLRVRMLPGGEIEPLGIDD